MNFDCDIITRSLHKDFIKNLINTKNLFYIKTSYKVPVENEILSQ